MRISKELTTGSREKLPSQTVSEEAGNKMTQHERDNAKASTPQGHRPHQGSLSPHNPGCMGGRAQRRVPPNLLSLVWLPDSFFLPVMSSALSKRRAVLYRRVVINQVLSSSFLSALPSRGLRDWRQEAPNAMKERHQGENLQHPHGALGASRKGLLF